MNFVKKTKRTTAGHRLALKVLEACQQAEPAMYLKVAYYSFIRVQDVYTTNVQI